MALSWNVEVVTVSSIHSEKRTREFKPHPMENLKGLIHKQLYGVYISLTHMVL